MNGKTILSVASPLTQRAEAVKQLIEYLTGKPCEELPATFALAKGTRLTKSSKGDCFYITTPTNCSCPARAYNPGVAGKHMRALLDENGVEASRYQARAYQARQRELKRELRAKGSSQEVNSIRPAVKWDGGYNGPVLEVS